MWVFGRDGIPWVRVEVQRETIPHHFKKVSTRPAKQLRTRSWWGGRSRGATTKLAWVDNFFFFNSTVTAPCLAVVRYQVIRLVAHGAVEGLVLGRLVIGQITPIAGRQITAFSRWHINPRPRLLGVGLFFIYFFSFLHPLYKLVGAKLEK